MVRSIRWLALASALLVTTAACGDDDTGPSGDASFTATVDGANFTGSLAIQASHNSNVLAVAGTGNGTQIMITIPNVTTTGQFNVGAGNPGIAQVVVGTSVWSSTLVGGTGTVNVTTLNDDGAAGTFTFTGMATPGSPATGQKVVTNGTFNVKF